AVRRTHDVLLFSMPARPSGDPFASPPRLIVSCPPVCSRPPIYAGSRKNSRAPRPGPPGALFPGNLPAGGSFAALERLPAPGSLLARPIGSTSPAEGRGRRRTLVPGPRASRPREEGTGGGWRLFALPRGSSPRREALVRGKTLERPRG